MEKYIIEGGRKLEGLIKISGSKNAALPIIAATILNCGVSIIENCPDIHDVKMMFTILEELGANVEKHENKVIIDTSKIDKTEIPANLMREMRSSVIIAGALLGRFKKCTFTYPGGCEIGARPINMHIDGFKQMGVTVNEEYGYITCESNNLKATDITLDFPSVGATENIMLASCLAEGTTYIRNVAREPEIKDLQDFLNEMGAKVKGAGSNTIVITGVKKLHDVNHKVIADRIEAGTYLCMIAATQGRADLINVNSEHISAIIHKLKRMGLKIKNDRNTINIESNGKLSSTTIKTSPYPGFPTDMQSQIAALLTTAKGTSIIVENIFENRYKYINELIRMGANVNIEGKTAIIQGVPKLFGTEVETKDLRGGAALILAGLMAEGTTKVSGINYVERGYENLIEKLSIIGAKIYKE
ncbi:MAG: UDP-N-acetylglucosamine 1-carboxyvinyltransferase [Clostridia bacterium]|nr:UDP-N-acetylglucosamine 1-carboxyvinyltransferase [Clostridia bacterium]